MTGKLLFFILLCFSFQTVVIAQENDHHEEEHHPAHEIGFSVSPVYFTGEGEFSVATHIHYTYNFPESKFGLGLGYERIFDEHKHNFIGAEFSYRIIHPLSLSLSPGVAFEGEHPDDKEFALHFETVYEFEFGVFHLGPVFEVAWHPENYHISLGLHIGLGL